MNYMSTITRPQIPYMGSINGSLHQGKVIEIRGIVPYGADVFTINLTTGMDTVCDRPLHISVRFNGRVAVRNTLQYNQWGPEERGGIFPFQIGRQFFMRIVVQQSSYEISVDGQHCWSYYHRIPISRVTSMLIDGTVGIDRIDYINNNTYSYPQPQQPVYRPQPVTNLVPVYNPSIPYAYPITGGLKSSLKIYISARPTMPSSFDQHRFTINLQCGSAPYPPPNIAFHFDVRFFNHTIVRNTRTNNQWGPEELAVPHFPFQPNVNFDMMIRMNGNKYMVAVNGQEFIEYRHRIKPLSCIDTLFIEKDIAVSSIRFA